MRTSARAMIVLVGTAIGMASIVCLSGQERKPGATRIYFSALNKEEKPVLGLTPSDFELRINGKSSALEDFRAGRAPADRSVPLAAWILISFVPSIQSQAIQRQAHAAAAAFEKLHPDSVLGIKLISDRSETLAPLAHDPAAMRGAFLEYSQRRSELRVGSKSQSVPLGEGGMARAVDLALDELDQYVASSSVLRGREVHHAVMMISAGDINPSYKMKPLYAKAARQSAFLYPVFVPTRTYGQWVLDFFDMAKKTAGVASVEGALRPGSKVLPLPRNNQQENALDANFIHLVRDLNGKYSFLAPPTTDGRKLRLELKCKVKGIEIRLPRTSLP
jgi:hypothetical protein